jgi:hypothetical protein
MMGCVQLANCVLWIVGRHLNDGRIFDSDDSPLSGYILNDLKRLIGTRPLRDLHVDGVLSTG